MWHSSTTVTSLSSHRSVIGGCERCPPPMTVFLFTIWKRLKNIRRQSVSKLQSQSFKKIDNRVTMHWSVRRFRVESSRSSGTKNYEI